MPRKRMVHPQFFESVPLSEIPVEAMVTYEGLWCFGDDRGRIEDDAAMIKFKVWPRRHSIDIGDVTRHLDALVDGEQLCRYSIGGGRFLHVIAWDEHQRVSHPTPSKLPPCPVHQPAEYSFWWKDSDTATDRWRKKEKADQKAKSGPVDSPESIANESGATPPQCSSVQLRSDQADLASHSGKVHQFIRPSQQRRTS